MKAKLLNWGFALSQDSLFRVLLEFLIFKQDVDREYETEIHNAEGDQIDYYSRKRLYSLVGIEEFKNLFKIVYFSGLCPWASVFAAVVRGKEATMEVDIAGVEPETNFYPRHHRRPFSV